MRVDVTRYPLGRKVYRKKFFSEQAIDCIYCFVFGFAIALMIAVAIL